MRPRSRSRVVVAKPGPGAILTVAIALLVGACDGTQLKQQRRMQNFTIGADDYNNITAATFALIDPKGMITTIALPSTLDPRAVAALQRVRKTVPFVPAAPTAIEILPDGYFLIRTFTIVADDDEPQAMIEGQLGPVTRTMTAANLPDCGKYYSVVFFIKAGDWYNPSYKVESCAESRHWVPVDTAQP